MKEERSCPAIAVEITEQEGCKNTTCSRYDNEESENCMMNGQYQISEVCPNYGGIETAEGELKPCPFCGDKAHIFLSVCDWYIQCQNVYCMVQPSVCCTDNKQETIDIWNKRHA